MSVEITTVEAKSIPFELKPDPRQKGMAKQIELPAAFLVQLEEDYRRMATISAAERWAAAWSITVKIIPLIYRIILGVIMGNWKTTLTAVVTAFAAILAHFGLEVSVEIQGIILSIGLALVGFFAKDATGAPESAPPPTYGRKP